MTDSMAAEESPSGASVPDPAEARARPICGFWRRIHALTIDGSILFGFGIWAGLNFEDQLVQWGWRGPLVGFLLAWLYFGIFNSRFGRGQTLGKRSMQIRVVGQDGEPISLVRSLARAAILEVPIFLNGIMLPPEVWLSPLGDDIGWITYGLGGGLVYLYIANRETRQSLHDLLCRTYVVKARAEGPIRLGRVAPIHIAVLSLYLVCLIAVPSLINPRLGVRGTTPELLALQQRLMRLEGASFALVKVGGRGGPEDPRQSLHARVYFRRWPDSFEAQADRVARVILDTYPAAGEQDLIGIRVYYGYNIGIARWYRYFAAAMAPGEWRERFVAERVEEDLQRAAPAQPVAKEDRRAAEQRLKELNRASFRLQGQRYYDEALAKEVEALKLAEELYGPTSPQVESHLNSLKMLYSQMGRDDKAVNVHERIVAMRKERVQKQSPAELREKLGLADHYASSRQYDKAEEVYLEVLAALEEDENANPLMVASALDGLARVYYRQGRSVKAEPLIQRAREIREEFFGPDRPENAGTLHNLGVLATRRGEFYDAEAYLLRALALQEKAYGADHWRVAPILSSLAMVYYLQGSYDRAEPLCQRSLKIHEQADGPRHYSVAPSLSCLGWVSYYKGQLARAESLFKRSAAIQERWPSARPEDLAITYGNLAWIYGRMGREAERREMAERAGLIWARLGRSGEELGHVHQLSNFYKILEGRP